jgi:hypothetical protein
MLAMSKRTPRNLIAITAGAPFQPDPDVVKLIIGGSRNVLNWRTGEDRPLEKGEVRPFPLTHARLIVKTELANAGQPSDPCVDRILRQGTANAMKRFNIGPNNEVTAVSGEEKEAEGGTLFHSEQELRERTSEWPAARLIEIWNGLAGVARVRKFKDRATAISRIWKQIQTLEAAAPKPVRKAAVKKSAASKSKAPKAEAAEAPAATKKEQVLALLRLEEGATLQEIMAATGWQKHSVRGFLSGAVHKKMGLTVLSAKNSAGERVYRLKR